MDSVVLRLILLFVCFSYGDTGCIEYYKTSTKTCGGWFGWWGCETKYISNSRCCEGYISSTSWPFATSCDMPLCNRGYGHDTCNKIYEGYVKYKDGRVVRNSGGTCYAPSKCKNCNEGYYPETSDNGYCKACHRPSNCNRAVCTTSSDYTCEYCVEEYNRDKPGYNVYTGKPDNRQCQRTCSWKDGARCFPGTCTDDMVLSTDCKCAPGFGGTNCATATSERKPIIKNFFLSLVDSSNHKFIVDKALNKPKFWTKETDWSEITLNTSSHYKLEINSAGKPNYTTNYSIGIEHMNIGLALLRGSDKVEMSISGGCTNFDENCDKELAKQNLKSLTAWQRIFKGTFMHGDRIKFTVSAKNGGKIYYEDRSNFDNKKYQEKQYFLNGITTTEVLEVEFDLYPPVHCFEQSNDCKMDALKSTDFLTQPKVTVYWDGWSDADSGVEEYVFDIYQLRMTTIDGPLTNGKMLKSKNASSSYSSLTLDLDEPGPYSIEMITYDRARNFKAARRIVIFDNLSVVDLHGNKSKITQATENNWINEFTDIIEVVWPGRFRNFRHSNRGWLNEIEESKDIQRDLDDRHGRSQRTIEKIDNVDGVIYFEIAHFAEFQNNTQFTDFQRIPDEYFHSQKIIYTNEKLIYGKRLTYFIRGYDVVSEFAEDNVTVMIDLSPPIIQNLWLTKGDLVNISVHSVSELKDLT